jgi:hypothetical protein
MSMPPSQPRRPSTPPTRPRSSSTKRAWPRRHPIWSALIAIFALSVIIATTNGTGSTNASSNAAAPSPRPAGTPKPTAHKSSLICDAQAISKRPADHTIVKIQVHTVAHAQVTVAGPLPLQRGESAAGWASANGSRTLRFRVGDATPGLAVVITVRVSSDGSQGSCQASVRPRPAPATAVAAPAPAPTSPPSPAPAPASPPSPAPAPPPATAASCYPLSDEGTCYEPGEFCRDDDHGMTGVAGDGETITCEDNDGWRWEPA